MACEAWMLHVLTGQLLEHEAHLAKGSAHELPPLDVPAWPALVPQTLSKPEVNLFSSLAWPVNAAHSHRAAAGA